METWKYEIMDVEQAFCDMAKSEGIPRAFIHFAAEDAVVMREEKLFTGKTAIADLYNRNKEKYSNVTLTWKPDFIDVAASGDLAYTYGRYTFTSVDSAGCESSSEGIFHTIWKRQVDGSWRFVWD
ncbi:MAG: nuclear transport factor 2 family protein [Candidatus Marinimicrobia bacterium]|nr:nuclear transport factor 2 family protein [Candidatus Neomarinimicrobiota bacterium]